MTASGKILFCAVPSGSYRQLCTIKSDGTGFTQLTSDFHDWGWARWSKDGSLILAAAQSVPLGEVPLWILNADGTPVRQLTSAAANGVIDSWQGDWSPDGTQVVALGTRYGAGFSGTCDLQIINVDDSGSTAVVLTKGVTQAINSVISWSPDGTKFLFTTTETSDSEAPYSINATACNIDGTGSHDILAATTGGGDVGYLPWRWYSDSTNILAVERHQGSPLSATRLIKSDGSITTAILSSASQIDAHQCLGAMSGDGTTFVWNSADAASLFELVVPASSATAIYTGDIFSDGMDWMDVSVPLLTPGVVSAGSPQQGLLRFGH